jgi:hypothetical protein
MRILNIVYNAEIKYQQHINSKNINTMIFGLTGTLEKPTRGKPVREGDFYYLGASEKFCYSMFIFRNLNDKLISITVQVFTQENEQNSSKLFSEFSAINYKSAPRFLCLQMAVWMP